MHSLGVLVFMSLLFLEPAPIMYTYAFLHYAVGCFMSPSVLVLIFYACHSRWSPCMSHEALSGHTCNLPSFPGQPWPGWSFWRRGPPAATTGLNGRRRRATAVVAILIRESCGCTAVAEVAPGTDDGRRLRVDFSLHDHQYSVITAYTPATNSHASPSSPHVPVLSPASTTWCLIARRWRRLGCSMLACCRLGRPSVFLSAGVVAGGCLCVCGF